jgi:hypothetical protein
LNHEKIVIDQNAIIEKVCEIKYQKFPPKNCKLVKCTLRNPPPKIQKFPILMTKVVLKNPWYGVFWRPSFTVKFHSAESSDGLIKQTNGNIRVFIICCGPARGFYFVG